MADMLPCPFCGGVVALHHPQGAGFSDITYVLCDGCGLVGSFRPNLKGRAAIAAWNTRVSPQAGSVPGGFVLVPKVPTPEMQRAGIAHVLRLNEEENDPGSDEHYRASGCLYAVWMDMLAAAPAPQRKGG